MPRHVHQGSYAHAWGLKTVDGCKESDLGITLCHSSHTWRIFLKLWLFQLEVLNPLFQRILGPTQYPHLEPRVSSWDVVSGRG